MTIFRNIKDSVYNPTFYKECEERTFGHAMGYFAKFLLIISLITSVGLSIKLLPVVRDAVSEKIVSSILSIYPEELSVSINSGKVSANVPQPYAIPMPNQWKIETQAGAQAFPKNLIVIDTTKPFVLENFAEYNTGALVTEKFLVYQDSSKGKLQIQSFESIASTTINKAMIVSAVNSVLPIIKKVLYVIPIAIFLGWFALTFMSSLITIAIISLIIWIVEKIRKTNMEYGKIYKLGLYAITLPIVLDMILGLISFRFVTPWYLFYVVFLAVFYLNIKTPKTQVPTVQS